MRLFSWKVPVLANSSFPLFRFIHSERSEAPARRWLRPAPCAKTAFSLLRPPNTCHHVGNKLSFVCLYLINPFCLTAFLILRIFRLSVVSSKYKGVQTSSWISYLYLISYCNGWNFQKTAQRYIVTDFHGNDSDVGCVMWQLLDKYVSCWRFTLQFCVFSCFKWLLNFIKQYIVLKSN